MTWAAEVDRDMDLSECPCLERGPRDYERTELGVDPTNGRFADVTLRVCRQCGRRWLHYQFEFEAFTRSGRWYAGVMTPEQAAGLTPANAAAVLESLPWHVYGGSYYGHDGRRGSGPVL